MLKMKNSYNGLIADWEELIGSYELSKLKHEGKTKFFCFFFLSLEQHGSFHCGSDGKESACKESACNAGDPSSIPGLGGSPGEGNDNPIQYSYVENSVDRGAWQATVHGVSKSQI